MERRITLQITVRHLNDRVTITVLSYLSTNKGTSLGENLQQTNFIIKRVLCLAV